MVNEDGTTSNGSIFTAFDDNNFYLDYVKYTVEEGHLVVSGYDRTGFKGEAKIVSSITYKQNTYKVLCIGEWAFRDCSILSKVVIPNSITSIRSSAFYNCTGLTTVNIPSGVTRIESEVFVGCSSLVNITIPNSVTSIGYWAFRYCSNLTDLIIPNSVTSIMVGAFEGCSSMSNIRISENIKSIEYWTFKDYSNLTGIIIPASVTNIGWDAFDGCSGLKAIHCLSMTPPEFYSDDFGNSFDNNTFSKATLYVPKGALDAYKESHWQRFENIVEE